VRLDSVPSAKFTAPLLPGQSLHVALVVDEAAKSARFTLSAQGRELASGRVGFVDE